MGTIQIVRRVPLRRVIIESVFVGYALALLVIVLAPFGNVGEPAGRYLAASINLVPFHTIMGLIRELPGQVIRQLGGNAAMFVPLGVLLPMLFERFRQPRALATTALVTSLVIEVAQLAMRLMSLSPRSFDIDDVLLNCAGALVGFTLWWVASRSITPQDASAEGEPESA